MNLNRFKNLNFKNKIFYLSLAFVSASLLIVYTILIPVLSAIKIKRTEIVTQKIELEQRLNKEKNMTSLSAKIKKIEPLSDKLANIYINQNRELEFITTLEGVASANDISQSINLDIATRVADGHYSTVPLEISANGAYDDILAYLISLETMNYYINITDWQFSSGGTILSGSSLLSTGSQDSPRASEYYTLRLTAKTYWK